MIKPLLLPLVLAAGLATGALHAQNAMHHPMSAADPAPRDPALKPVFDEFGGKPGLTALVDDFMANLMADPRTRPFFADTDRRHIKAELVDQFCVILDGPCTYTGKNMEQTHRGLDIHRSQFNALVEDLQKAMDKHGIPFRAQNKLLAKLAPMHREVVTK
jgi:hemoglobin